MEDRIIKGVIAHIWLQGGEQDLENRFRVAMQNMGMEYPFRQADITFVMKTHKKHLLKQDIGRHMCLSLMYASIKRGLKVAGTDGRNLYFPVSSNGALVSYYVKAKGLKNSKADKWKSEFLQDKEKRWMGDVEYYVIPMDSNEPLLGYFQGMEGASFITDIQRLVQKKWISLEGVSLAERGLSLRHEDRTYLLTDHAIEQWRERCKEVFGDRRVRKVTTPEGVIRSFTKMLIQGTPLKRKNHIRQIIKNKFRLSQYLGWEGWVVVIEEGDVIKTVYYKGPSYEGYEYGKF